MDNKRRNIGKKGDLIFEDLDPTSHFIGIANGKGGLISKKESNKIYNQFLKMNDLKNEIILITEGLDSRSRAYKEL